MAIQFLKLLLLLLLLLLSVATATAKSTFGDVPTISFHQGYKSLFGDDNLITSLDGRKVNLVLTRWTGSGFISTDLYNHGLFSASIKLPSDYSAGVVVAFYTSNGDVFEKTHDELDFEFLGNIRGKEWRIQTNVYGNGSTSRGREERYLLPFDPTEEAHRYSILWTADTIIFYIDNNPIREVRRSDAMGGDYPSKPMALYATIWDGSVWATEGGRYKANYKYAPFVSEFSDLVLHGCRTSPLEEYPSAGTCAESDAALASAGFSAMTPAKRAAMLRYRARYMTYSFCHDLDRYPVSFPDCDAFPPEERELFWHSGHVKVQQAERGIRRRRSRRGTRAAVHTVRAESSQSVN